MLPQFMTCFLGKFVEGVPRALFEYCKKKKTQSDKLVIKKSVNKDMCTRHDSFLPRKLFASFFFLFLI